jgi:hypothetical protein
MAEIRRFARQVAERFQPEKIILFGSHAYGTPHADSDVDILVICMRRAAREWARKAEDDFRLAATIAGGSEPFHDQLCFHCQQSAEKYLIDFGSALGQPGLRCASRDPRSQLSWSP